MMLYDTNGNYINTEPMWDHIPNLMIKAYQNLWSQIICGDGQTLPRPHFQPFFLEVSICHES